VILVLVRPLLRHSLLTLLLEAKLTLVTISPTIVTMKAFGLSLRLGMGLLLGFSPLGLSPFFSPTSLSLVVTNFNNFWKSFVRRGNMGGSRVVSSFFSVG
jgi:hypothetical protein